MVASNNQDPRVLQLLDKSEHSFIELVRTMESESSSSELLRASGSAFRYTVDLWYSMATIYRQISPITNGPSQRSLYILLRCVFESACGVQLICKKPEMASRFIAFYPVGLHHAFAKMRESDHRYARLMSERDKGWKDLQSNAKQAAIDLDVELNKPGDWHGKTAAALAEAVGREAEYKLLVPLGNKYIHADPCVTTDHPPMTSENAMMSATSITAAVGLTVHTTNQLDEKLEAASWPTEEWLPVTPKELGQ